MSGIKITMPKGGRTPGSVRMYRHSFQEIVEASMKAESSVRYDVRKKVFDPRDLVSVCEYVVANRLLAKKGGA